MNITISFVKFNEIIINIHEELEKAYPEGFCEDDFGLSLGVDEYNGVTTVAWVLYNKERGDMFVVGISNDRG